MFLFQSGFFAWQESSREATFLLAETFLQRLGENLNTILSIEIWSGFCILGEERQILHKLRRSLSSVIDKFWFSICRKYIISCRRRRRLQVFPQNRRRGRMKNTANTAAPRHKDMQGRIRYSLLTIQDGGKSPLLLVQRSSTRRRLILNSYIHEISSFHTWWKYPENSGAFLRFRGVSYSSGKETGKTAFTFPGRRDRTRIRSAILIASARSWVISRAVFFVSRIIALISSQTARRV